MANVQQILRLVKSPKRVGTGWTAHCPAHADEQPSLSISVGDDGRILLHCHAGCPTERIVQAMGLTMKDLFPNNGSAEHRPRPQRPTAVYEYTDEIGNIVYRVLRYETEKGKEFKVYHREGPNWLPGLGDKKKLLYRLHDVVQAVEAGDTIFIVEGEKDVDRLRQLGLTATTNPFGAGKWLPEYSEWLKGANVVVIPDNDDVGRRHAADVIESVFPLAFSTFLLELPDLPEHGDVSDWLNAGHTSEELLELAENLECISDPARVTAKLRPKEDELALPAGTQAPTDEPSANPIIELVEGREREAVEKAEQALTAAGVPIFARDTILVEIILQSKPASNGRTTVIPKLNTLTANGLLNKLERVAAWRRFEARSKAWVPTEPPKRIAELMLERADVWPYPELTGVITCPTLRRDCSVLAQPGYDEATGLYLVHSVDLPEIPSSPSREDALAALDLLLDLLKEFPFSDEASKSVALSELITPVVRGALDRVPLHANSSPSPRTGKSYLVDLASAVVQGTPCPVIAAARTDGEELGKRLQTAALTGKPLISIDNISCVLTSDFLCQLIERPLLSIRLLGSHTEVTVKNQFTVFATGNNLTISDDLVPRTVRCMMDANVEEPEDREFHSNPFEKILENRGAYISACLTIPLAYHAAGYPNPLNPVKGFESWSNLVRSALVWLGCEDPVVTTKAIREEDPAVQQLRAVVEAWAAGVDAKKLPEAVTVKTLVEAAKTDSGLQDALEAVAGHAGLIDPRRLGQWLRRQKDKVVRGWKVTAFGTAHGGLAKWGLIPMDSDHADADEPLGDLFADSFTRESENSSE